MTAASASARRVSRARRLPPAPAVRGRRRCGRRGRAGAAGGLPKSTFGGALTAASSSTVKLGLTSMLEHHRRQVGRELAHRRVELLHRLDVAVARDGDAVLGAFELRLQVAEQRVGLEVRIVLGDDQQPRQRARAAGSAPAWNFWNAAGSLMSSGVALMPPTFARALVTSVSTVCFLRRVALDRVDEIRHEIGAALVLVQHFRPRGLDALVLPLQRRCSRSRRATARRATANSTASLRNMVSSGRRARERTTRPQYAGIRDRMQGSACRARSRVTVPSCADACAARAADPPTPSPCRAGCAADTPDDR